MVSTKARDITKRLKNKQAGFLDNVVRREIYHIKSLFKKHPNDENINLLKILTSLRSKRFPQRQLFISIEQEYDEGHVLFQYSSEMENEADDIIPVIPLFIKGVFGDILKSWFKPSADIGIKGYEFIENDKKVIPSKDNVLSNLDEDWDQALTRYDDDSLSNADSINDDEYGGFSIEFGELKIDNEDRIGNLEDSTSTGTLGMPKPDNFIDPDTQLEESSQGSESTSPSTIQEDIKKPNCASNLEDFENLNLEENKNKYPSRFVMTTLKPAQTSPSSGTSTPRKGDKKRRTPKPCYS